ncbi:hypothetical protein GCM10023084_31460 [Streptomyces lacrimifluminis]|uniref:Integral-membrane protein n=1 Tax=Streptomyces lacrimifluminis TaxID=1500077 RepID=A0A917KUC0_9ACTN|nr:hypothetical protein [Streptomyces lacrimifluminis]GGJ29832.1 hypothetical protein GCM10012282_28080 [Streptomyces lacrimifluminis]
MTAGWCSRTLRAAVFAAVCVLLAALGHVMMSGSRVPWWTLVAGAAVTGAAGWCLTGRERGVPLIVSVVVVAQTALHSAFSLAQSGTHPAVSAPGGMASMDMSSMDMSSMGHDMGSLPMNSAHMDVAHMDSMDMAHMDHFGHAIGDTSSFGMLSAHLLAALLCGLWLGHGERAAFRVLRAVGGRLTAPLRLLLALPTPPHRPRIRVRLRSDRVPRGRLLVHAITSRGPPVGTAVV